MDNSKEWKTMLSNAIEQHPLEFKKFDKAKNLQDQLQEMLPKGNEWSTMPRKYTRRLLEFANSQNYKMFGTSMEQLWLLVYMSENHQKIWDGKKWIKSE